MSNELPFSERGGVVAVADSQSMVVQISHTPEATTGTSEPQLVPGMVVVVDGTLHSRSVHALSSVFAVPPEPTVTTGGAMTPGAKRSVMA